MLIIMVLEAKRRTRCLNPDYNGIGQRLPEMTVGDGEMTKKKQHLFQQIILLHASSHICPFHSSHLSP